MPILAGAHTIRGIHCIHHQHNNYGYCQHVFTFYRYLGVKIQNIYEEYVGTYILKYDVLALKYVK